MISNNIFIFFFLRLSYLKCGRNLLNNIIFLAGKLSELPVTPFVLILQISSVRIPDFQNISNMNIAVIKKLRRYCLH